jgi:Icc-related predicted phosphoesterase
VIDSFRRFIDTIVAVHGNCDFPETGDWLRDQGLSARAPGVAIGGVRFRGVGGSLPCPGRTPSELSDTQLAGALADLDADASSGEPTAIIAHQPPYDTIADNAGPAGHVGSRALRACIERTRPLAVFCGHIHESFGVQTLGPTAVINPGSFRHGRYAAVEMSAAGVTRVDLLSVKVR